MDLVRISLLHFKLLYYSLQLEKTLNAIRQGAQCTNRKHNTIQFKPDKHVFLRLICIVHDKVWVKFELRRCQ